MTDDSGGRTEIVREARDLNPATAAIADELSKQVQPRLSVSRKERPPVALDSRRGPHGEPTACARDEGTWRISTSERSSQRPTMNRVRATADRRASGFRRAQDRMSRACSRDGPRTESPRQLRRSARRVLAAVVRRQRPAPTGAWSRQLRRRDPARRRAARAAPGSVEDHRRRAPCSAPCWSEFSCFSFSRSWC